MLHRKYARCFRRFRLDLQKVHKIEERIREYWVAFLIAREMNLGFIVNISMYWFGDAEGPPHRTTGWRLNFQLRRQSFCDSRVLVLPWKILTHSGVCNRPPYWHASCRQRYLPVPVFSPLYISRHWYAGYLVKWWICCTTTSDCSDPTVKQLIIRMNERQHDLIIEVCIPSQPDYHSAVGSWSVGWL